MNRAQNKLQTIVFEIDFYFILTDKTTVSSKEKTKMRAHEIVNTKENHEQISKRIRRKPTIARIKRDRRLRTPTLKMCINENYVIIILTVRKK